MWPSHERVGRAGLETTMAVKWIAIWGLVSIAASLLSGLIAGIKNRDVSFWMGWCFVLPPMMIALLLIPKLEAPRPRPASDDDERD